MFFDLLKHPLFISVISIGIGGWLLALINHKRSQNDIKRTKSIDFIETVGADINEVISPLYRAIRSEGKVKDIERLEKLITKLFQKRMVVRVKSRAYLENDNFLKQYESFIHELQAIVVAISNVGSVESGENTLTEIEKRIKEFSNKWNIEIRENVEKLSKPYGALIDLLNMVWVKIDDMLSTQLKNVIHR